MSWKSLLTAGFAVCVLSSSVVAAPTVTVTPSTTVNAQGNRVWTVRIVPDASITTTNSALAVELPFTITPGSSTRPMSIIDDAGNVNDTNTQAASNGNDTWYYNQVSSGDASALWNVTDSPVNINDFTQNNGANPFTAGTTSGLYVSGANVFAALGSTIITSANPVNTMQIVTLGKGGILSMGAGVVAQNGVQTVIPAQNFYVPGDFNGDGRVENADFNLLSFNFNKPKPATWTGYQPVNPNQIANSEFNALSFNFGSGVSAGAGGGSAVPEPASVMLVLSALAIGGAFRRNRRNG